MCICAHAQWTTVSLTNTKYDTYKTTILYILCNSIRNINLDRDNLTERFGLVHVACIFFLLDRRRWTCLLIVCGVSV